MKNIFNSIFKVMVVAVGFAAAATATAQESEEPIITFRTDIYNQSGPTSTYNIVIGATEAGHYIDVDCGFGKVEYELEESVMDYDTGTMSGTVITCQATTHGEVKIYGEPEIIDYFNADGCYIERIDFPRLSNLKILSMSHNMLRSLDLTPFTNLGAIYLGDNPFTEETPLIIGGNKPNLVILEVPIVDWFDPNFDLKDYPNMISFDAYHTLTLNKIDPTGCPALRQLSLELTNVASVDVSQNPLLQILNVSDTKVTEIDVTNNPKLRELYCSHGSGSYNSSFKISSLDLTHNPELVYLFCQYNNLRQLDISACENLVGLYASYNYLESIDVSHNTALYNVKLDHNCLDFATLPIDPGTWGEYDASQREMDVEESYVQGTTLDFSARVLREGYETTATLYEVSEYNPINPSVLPDDYITFANGKVTLNKIPTDSCYVSFACTAFPGLEVRTKKFKVKTEAEYGKPDKVMSFNSIASTGSPVKFAIGIYGASEETPKNVMVDFGNNTTETFTVTDDGVPYMYGEIVYNIQGVRSGYGPIAIYVDSGEEVSTFYSDNIEMTTVDVSAMASMNALFLKNAGLYSINLERNRCLEHLDLTNNNLYNIDLSGINEYYAKNRLQFLCLDDNNISEITLNNILALRELKMNNNKIQNIDFSNADNLSLLSISNNLFTELKLTHCTQLTRLFAANNNISSIIFPEENNIKVMDISGNKFTLETLPETNSGYTDYSYAPQQPLQIATKGPGCDLSAQNRIVDGIGTQYQWRKASDGTVLTEGVDYTIANGKTRFINTEVGNIYCEMTNAAFPDFTGDKVYRTTEILSAGMPTNEIASFVTANNGDAVVLSLAANKAGDAVYFDWEGDGNVTQYVLDTTYRLFDATTYAGKTVKVYTYEPSETVSVFSITGAKMTSFDGSKLTDTRTITVKDAGLSAITLPQSSKLCELNLSDNNFTSFDLSPYSGLVVLSLNNNRLTTLDLSNNSNLQVASASGNKLSNVVLNNPNLWALYVGDNQLKSISFDNALSLQQIELSHNLLTTLDVGKLSQLRALAIDNNYFRFSTLPAVKSAYTVYYYQPQAPIEVAPVEGVIDLASEAEISGVATTYRWYLDMPVVNPDTGELEGEELIEDTEYSIDGGVTRFMTPIDNVMCVMTNGSFPNMYQYTNLFDVKEAGVDDVAAEDVNAVVKGRNIIISTPSVATARLYSVSGALMRSTACSAGESVIAAVEPGIYVLSVGKAVFKVIVK